MKLKMNTLLETIDLWQRVYFYGAMMFEAGGRDAQT